ncbi:MAG: hypothetical protein LBJ00_00310 [Planctomycetaceae bacterium]|jgi:hypothetical protein|nr:hypothetical protein [Planctomycetaceae bacterium]
MIKYCELWIFAVTMLSSLGYGDEIKNNVVTSVDVFPREVEMCDSIYFSVNYLNNTDYPIESGLHHGFVFTNPDAFVLKCFIVVGGRTWEFIPYVPFIATADFFGKPDLPPKSCVRYCYKIRVPDLENLQDSFWSDLSSNLSRESKEVILQIVLGTHHEFQTIKSGSKLLIFNEKLKIKPRNDKEMNIITSWYKNTPVEILPIPHPINTQSTYSISKRKIDRDYRVFLRKTGIDDRLQFILRLGDRYPYYPNLPEDWQGWKKLEESFEASTLRDEIRWTRICVQYCTTGDDKVLDELKTWLEKMNPIQRSVMVNYFHKNEKLPNSDKLYETIQLFKDKK